MLVASLPLPSTPRVVRAALWGLVLVNLEIFRDWRAKGLVAPRLYLSGVVYRPERGRERWQTAEQLLSSGEGDCEDLTCYRVAERLFRGRRAAPDVTPTQRGSLHALLASGEDPSRVCIALERQRRR